MRIPSSLIAAALVLAGQAGAQEAPRPRPLAVGADAPGFSLPSATRGGIGKAVGLEDFRGQTVVLAFFPRARTGG